MRVLLWDFKLKDKYEHILKSHFPPRQAKQYYQSMPAANKDPLPIVYTSAEETGVHADVDICAADSVKEAHKPITITELLSPFS